jgi:hypothetical protein
MVKKSKKIYLKIYTFITTQFAKLVFIVIVFAILQYLLTLPYINLFASIFSYIPHLVGLILVLLFFRPTQISVLLTGLTLLAISYPFLLINVQSVSEILGVFSYFLLGAYVIMKIKEVYFR